MCEKIECQCHVNEVDVDVLGYLSSFNKVHLLAAELCKVHWVLRTK